MKTAIVAGATGAVGKALVYRLIESKTYLKVIAITRKPLPIKHHKLHELQVNYENLEEVKNQLMADDVFCCLGTTMKDAGSKEAFYKVDFEYVVNLANVCKQQGAQQFFLVSAMGADAQSVIYYNKVKGQIEQAVKALGFYSFVAIRPSLLLTARASLRPGERMAQRIMKLIGFFFMGPLKKYKAIPVDTVAKAMINLAAKQTQGNQVVLNDALFNEAIK